MYFLLKVFKFELRHILYGLSEHTVCVAVADCCHNDTVNIYDNVFIYTGSCVRILQYNIPVLHLNY